MLSVFDSSCKYKVPLFNSTLKLKQMSNATSISLIRRWENTVQDPNITTHYMDENFECSLCKTVIKCCKWKDNVFLYVGNYCTLQNMYIYCTCDLWNTVRLNGCKWSCMQKWSSFFFLHDLYATETLLPALWSGFGFKHGMVCHQLHGKLLCIPYKIKKKYSMQWMPDMVHCF